MNFDDDRPPAYGARAAAPTSTMLAGDPMLKSDSILIAEFTYASGSAHEAVDDRARLFDRYLLIFGGVFVSGATAIYQLNQINAKNFIEPLAAVAFAFMGLLGFAFLRTFVRLRQAFVGAMIEMSKIKEYYFHYLREQAPHLSVAIGWRLMSVPETERTFTVSYLMAHLVATLDSVSFGLGVFVLVEAIQSMNDGNLLSLPHNVIPYAIAGGVGSAVLMAQLVYYKQACKGMTHAEKQEWLDKLHAQ
ncbi:MAG TPA: hypothetical protein VJO13_19540 [Ktedonobacterales bacterium]|nr:hypothetical protein [Ktedonobacterales bacterium]